MTLEEVSAEMDKRGMKVTHVSWTEGPVDVEARKQAFVDSLEKLLNGDYEVSTFDDRDLLDEENI